MVLKGQDNGRMEGIFFMESGYFFDNFFEFDRCCCSVSMFDNRPTIPIMNIYLHTSDPILQILKISFSFGIACKLIAC